MSHSLYLLYRAEVCPVEYEEVLARQDASRKIRPSLTQDWSDEAFSK